MTAHVKDDFSGLPGYAIWVDEKMKSLSPANRRHAGRYTLGYIQKMISSYPDWFGEGTTAEELVAGITRYKDPALIESLLGKMSEAVPVATTSRVKSRKMEFNDRGMGLFSFDRAAMGMYRLMERYSPSLARKVEAAECRREGGGWVLAADGTKVIEAWESRADGGPKVRTSSKKVFSWFPRRDKEKLAVEIYVGCGGNASLSASEMLYSGLAAVVLAQILEKARVPTKVTVAVGSSGDGWRTGYLSLIPVKGYEEPLDTNLVATLTSDPRFFRHEGFKGIVATWDHFNGECPPSLGSSISRDALADCIENSTYTKTARLAPNRVYLGGTYSEAGALAQVELAVNVLAEKLAP